MRASLAVCALTIAFLPVFPRVSAGSLIVNGGFETRISDGWTIVETGGGYYGRTKVGVHSGVYSVWFGDIDGMTHISQTIATIPGQSYLLTFWICNTDDPELPPQNRAELWWDGTLIESGTDAGTFNWIEVTNLLPATESSTVLEFAFNNAPGFWKLDDVSLSWVPEPATFALSGAALCLLAAFRRRSHSGARRN